jgi:hypothetical protein
MRRGLVSSLFIVSGTDQLKEWISTDPEEIFVENPLPSFTKLLQAHTYNTLHTSAARAKSFANECVNLKTMFSIVRLINSWPNHFRFVY